MIHFHLNFNDLEGGWVLNNQGWVSGSNHIFPYKHYALEDAHIRSEYVDVFVVREKCKSLPVLSNQLVPKDQLPALVSDLRQWPLQYQIIIIDRESNKAEILSGLWGTAPCFTVSNNDKLNGHWNPAELYRFLTRTSIDSDFAAQFLVGFNTPYSRKTIFPEMNALTAGSTAVWSKSGKRGFQLRIQYPNPVGEPQPRNLKSNMEVLPMFREILQESLKSWHSLEYPFTTELSGGLDSAIISSIAAQVSNMPVEAYGIIVPGISGQAQQLRRMELVKNFHLKNIDVSAVDYLPLSLSDKRIPDNQVVPWEEIYWSAFARLFQKASADKGQVLMLNGLGGDELFSPFWNELSREEQGKYLQGMELRRNERPDYLTSSTFEAYVDGATDVDYAPYSGVPISALEAAATGSANCLSNGVWPVSPFCTPELIWFCRSLPKEWRENRYLQREFLKQAGCSRSVTHPEIKESFSPVLELGLKMSSGFIDRLFKDSRLHDLGYIKAPLFLKEFSEYVKGKQPVYNDVLFYSTVILELTVRSLESKVGQGDHLHTRHNQSVSAV